MGGGLPKAVTSVRITYWTTASLEPAIEAVSKEVFDLAMHFRGSMVFGVSPHLGFRAGRRPCHLGLPSGFDPLLRLLIPAIERTTRINHVYAEIAPWLFHRTLRRRPTILTIASEKGEINADFCDHVDAVTVQTDAMLERMSQVERWRRKTSLVHPGVDLKRFTPSDRTAGPGSAAGPRVLFATFPRAREELGPRGVDLLIEIAKANLDIGFDLLTRPWASGDTASAVARESIAAEGRGNIRLIDGRSVRMEQLYRGYDFTVIPYTSADGGKECPLSLVEGLACGIPVMISRVAPFAGFVERNRCGVVFDPQPLAFRAAMDQALSSYAELSEAALACARRHFDQDEVFRRFARLYELVSSPGVLASRVERIV